MSKLVKLLLLFLIFIFAGCTNQPSIKKVSNSEIFDYEQKSLNNYRNLKSNYESEIKKIFIQPVNKKETCKVSVLIKNSKNKTLDKSYKLIWDGECKNGYAYGIGREFEFYKDKYIEQIGNYLDGIPKRSIIFYDRINNTRYLGNNNSYGSLRQIKIINNQFKIKIFTGFLGNTNPIEVKYYTEKSPLSLDKIYLKKYPNFQYQIMDRTDNYNVKTSYEYFMRNEKRQIHGYAIQKAKNSNKYGGLQFSNGKYINNYVIPISYYNYFKKTHKEIMEYESIANIEVIEAQKVKERYKDKICKKNSFPSKFLKKENYFNICNETIEENKLNLKIQDKIAKIKQNERDKQNAAHKQNSSSSSQNKPSGFSSLLNVLGAIAEGYNKSARKNTYSNSYTPPSTYSNKGCTSDYECGYGKICSKKAYAAKGICLTSVDKFGNPTNSKPNSSSWKPYTSDRWQCRQTGECPPGFKCVSHRCVK